MFVTHATQRYSLFLAYRICSIKRRGVYFIFSVSDAAFVQGRRLFEGGVCFVFLRVIINLKGFNLSLTLLIESLLSGWCRLPSSTEFFLIILE